MASVLSVSSPVEKSRIAPRSRPRAGRITADVGTTVSLVLIGLTLAAWSFVTCQGLNLSGLLFFLVYPWTVHGTGRLATRWLPVEPVLRRSFAFRFLVGVIVLTLVQFLIHSLVRGSLTTQFLILAGLVGLGQLVRWPEGNDRDPGQTRAELFLVVLCLLVATCWCRGLLVSIDVHDDQVIFRHWHDFFVHAFFISRFLGPKSLWSLGHSTLSGLPAPLYHYAGYLPAATAAHFTGSTALEAAVSTWVPLGNILMGLAAYTLVLSWSGWRGGLCAAIAVLMLPDASYLWPGNAVLRYHWLLQVCGAALYGVPTAVLAVVFLMQWQRHRRWANLRAAWATVFALFWFKAQIFAVVAPLLFGLTILWWPSASRTRRLVVFATVGALGLVLAGLLIHFQVVPDFGPSRAYLDEYNHSISKDFPEGFAKQVTSSTWQELGVVKYYALSITIYAIASFGVWLPLGALLLIGLVLRRKGTPYDLLPCVVGLLYLTFYAFLNDYALVGHNKWELIHRPIMWAYFVLTTWCAARLSQVLATLRPTRWLVEPAMIALVAVLLLPLPWRMGRSIQEGKSFWRSSCVNLSHPRGLWDCARFIARSGPRREIVQDSRNDEEFVLSGLSERRAYLAMPTTYLRDKAPRVRAAVEDRTKQLEQLKGFTTRDQLAALARQTRIRWYVLHPGDTVRWPAEILDKPAFTAQGFRVYDLKPRAATGLKTALMTE